MANSSILQLESLRTDQRELQHEQEQEKSPMTVSAEPRADSFSMHVEYRLYKRRWLGMIGMWLLNLASAMNWLWFSPIAIDTSREFGITLQQVNWLANCINFVYLPVSCLVPIVNARYGLRVTCLIGAASLLLSSWIRYAGTATSLSPGGSYALLFLGQVFVGIAQPVFQVLGPKYSETWFDLKGRTTATMLIAMSNPIGAALGSLIPPLVDSPRFSVLLLGIITTAMLPTVFFIGAKPPTPPTYAGSHPSPPMLSTLRAAIGRERVGEVGMTITERRDFFILTVIFGVLVAGTSAFSILINQIFAPHGYSNDASGIMGAALLLSGIIAAIVTAPLFDRVLTHHLALSVKTLLPVLATSWIGLIFAVKPNNYGGIYTVLILIGVTSFILLPVALELGVEITRNAETSSAALWFSGNLFSVIFVLVQDALRAGPDASPPFNMRRSLIFSGSIIGIVALGILGFTGRQTRRELDVEKIQENAHNGAI